MSGIWAVSVIASILILGLFGFSQDAVAQSPAQLIITTQPTNTVVNSPITVVVELRDTSGNLVPFSGPSIFASIGTDPSGGTAVLFGDVTVSAIVGIATFNNLEIDVVANGYTLTFSSGSLTIDTTIFFDVLPQQNPLDGLCPLIPGCLTDNLYVADNSFGTVRQYDSAGNLINADFVTDLTNSESIAFDSTGKLYVADIVVSEGLFLTTVRQYSSTGALLDANFITDLLVPLSLAFDSTGNLYVADSPGVSQYDGTGALLDANFITDTGTALSLAFDSTGKLYVADGGFDTVRQYDSAGNLLNADFITGLNNPESIAFDSTGNLYVTDSSGVRQYSSTGALLDTGFVTGRSIPLSIAFDSTGKFYVADFGLPRVSQYDSTGTLLDVDDRFIRDVISPRSIAFDFSLTDTAIGGHLISIDTTALLLAVAQSISLWMIPVVVAGVAIGVFVIKRRK